MALCLYQVLVYVGINYSSPTLSSAISNLNPAITFMLAIIFRMEKIDITSPSTIAKITGTVIAISGAMVFTFYQGPEIFVTLDSSDLLLSSQPSNWISGGLIIFLANIFGCIWNILQVTSHPDITLTPRLAFSFLIFDLCIDMFCLKAVYSLLFRVSALTWCLEKKGPVFVAMFMPLSIVIGVILGVTFLGDSLHLGSAIGAVIIATGFYAVMWGQAKEKNKLKDEMDNSLDFVNESGSSDHNAPLLQSSS
ncbi:WAT1-related protein At3g28050-like [Bidens hawaiensis]|uniref:WAT1-related protein At3g28050-like n=1 Tax=Bidens hawaiensis TaxID=980011 RepID=UPI00404B20F4